MARFVDGHILFILYVLRGQYVVCIPQASTWGGESLFQVSDRHGYVIQPLRRAFTP